MPLVIWFFLSWDSYLTYMLLYPYVFISGDHWTNDIWKRFLCFRLEDSTLEWTYGKTLTLFCNGRKKFSQSKLSIFYLWNNSDFKKWWQCWQGNSNTGCAVGGVKTSIILKNMYQKLKIFHTVWSSSFF